jgi:hypothetical protein
MLRNVSMIVEAIVVSVAVGEDHVIVEGDE